MAQTFGKTWWGQQWLNSLNNIDYSNRLPRGSTYARNGSVKMISIDENRIQAKVAGSRPSPYNVNIILPPFFDPELGHFMDAIARKPVIISKLFNRELDPEVLSIAEQMGLKVFPKQWTDFKMQCSCPDWAVPCKHLAAVIYKISAEIDNNPFLVFGLHRVDLIAELQKRGIIVTIENTEIPNLKDLYLDAQLSKKRKNVKFDAERAYQKLSYATLTPIYDPLSALLTDAPVFYTGNGNFKEKYVAALRRTVKNTQRIIQGKVSLENYWIHNPLREQILNTHSLNKIIVNEKFEYKVLVSETVLSVTQFIVQLMRIPVSQAPNYQPSNASLHTALHLSLHLLANGAIIPQIVKKNDGNYAIRWIPALLNKEVKFLIDQLQNILPPDTFIWHEKKTQQEIQKDTAVNVLSIFITELLSILNESDTSDLFIDMFFANKQYNFTKPGEESLCGGIHVWLQKYYITQGKYKPLIVVEESEKDSFIVNIHIIEKAKPLTSAATLKEVLTLKKFDKQRFEILQSLTQLSSFITGLDACINSKAQKPIVMPNNTFTPFLMQMIPAIQLLDIDISLPKSLKEILKPKASIKVKTKPGKSFLRIDQLLDFDWQVAIGNTVMGIEEFNKLLKNSDGLIKHKSKYIYVGSDDLEKLHKYFTAEKKLSPYQLLQTVLSGEFQGAHISLTDEVQTAIKELTQVKEIPLPKGINAKLRPYQKRGYAWMYRNSKIGFGSVIADDMGLGKTLQVIATLLKYKEEGLLKERKALVIAPTGLLTNWQSEIEKFAPTLKAHIFHGTGRKLIKNYDILLTSYGIARTDANKLKKLSWNTVVIDEAQNIKNQNTAQAKAIKSIPADNFIAMSGTPVENRLSELWSIMDYSNRGVLGTLKEFQENYGSPIETYNDISVADKLKRVTGPFVMRRLKSDKSIISDLPDKIEIDSYSNLVKEQAGLYEKTLEEAMKEIEAIDATDKKGLFVRQGLVLQMILALKQICNHPTQFLKNNILDASLSGKLNLLFDKLDSIIESNEKVLIFSQFTEMGKLLTHFIAERYRETPLFYHGGCSVKQRKEMVESFQNNRADKIFVLSLKAAGTGLNLTAANHVIHYDLWWNPAVEAQATDRAYRIGQKSNVMVHRFITKNTFEERINDMIQSKKALANMTVATGENWIGNLSNKELKQLFERQ
jgi:SNF2 family DNA or RNA helicase/uncharacterized Zn finger protein